MFSSTELHTVSPVTSSRFRESLGAFVKYTFLWLLILCSDTMTGNEATCILVGLHTRRKV